MQVKKPNEKGTRSTKIKTRAETRNGEGQKKPHTTPKNQKKTEKTLTESRL